MHVPPIFLLNYNYNCLNRSPAITLNWSFSCHLLPLISTVEYKSKSGRLLAVLYKNTGTYNAGLSALPCRTIADDDPELVKFKSDTEIKAHLHQNPLNCMFTPTDAAVMKKSLARREDGPADHPFFCLRHTICKLLLFKAHAPDVSENFLY